MTSLQQQTTRNTIMMQTNVEEFAATVAPKTKAMLYTSTVVKMNKKDVATKTIKNPYEKIFKTNCMLVTLNDSYEERVNQKLESEGKPADFKAEAMSYGGMIGNALLEHNGQKYVKCILEESIGKPTYSLEDGTVIAYDEFAQFVPLPPVAKNDDKPTVPVRNLKLESIIGFEIL